MDKKGTHNVKILAEKITMVGEPTGEQVGKKTSGRVNRTFLVSRKVRFLATPMFGQARHCSFGLTKTFIFRVLT